MNVTEALHCIGCGWELGLMPIEHQPSFGWNCPRCDTAPLDAFTSGDGIVHDCPRCGGQFVPHSMLALLVRRHQELALGIGIVRRPHPQNPLADRVTYLPCPNCRELMLRRNFGRFSGIVVDVCAAHGTWFDVGELPRILAFVHQGGMGGDCSNSDDETRQRAREQARESTALTRDDSSCDKTVSLEGMFDSARDFAKWVLEMMR